MSNYWAKLATLKKNEVRIGRKSKVGSQKVKEDERRKKEEKEEKN